MPKTYPFFPLTPECLILSKAKHIASYRRLPSFDGRKISEDVDRGLTGITGNFRKQQLFETIEKFGADVPLCKTDAPFLYMIARGDENEMSVFLMNAYEDSVLSPEVYVGDGYVRVEACNGTAELVDGKVVLSDISAYGFAAFTVYTN